MPRPADARSAQDDCNYEANLAIGPSSAAACQPRSISFFAQSNPEQAVVSNDPIWQRSTSVSRVTHFRAIYPRLNRPVRTAMQPGIFAGHAQSFWSILPAAPIELHDRAVCRPWLPPSLHGIHGLRSIHRARAVDGLQICFSNLPMARGGGFSEGVCQDLHQRG